MRELSQCLTNINWSAVLDNKDAESMLIIFLFTGSMSTFQREGHHSCEIDTIQQISVP